MDGAVCTLTMDPMSFAKRLRQARVAARMTQQQVADACGVTDGAVSAWENGVAAGIIAETLFCVADALCVDPRWLATGQGSPASLPDVAASLGELPPDQQEAVRALIRSLKR
jgi:transcriptional regulator with XRE-family HTH domain